MLDVACGGGLVVCAFAPSVMRATGIDVTPAMLARGRALAEERELINVTFDEGDVKTLPYADAAFTIVLSRFTFHHFLDPLAVLREMVRVCAPGGTVMVVDVQASADPAKAAEFNRMEKLRDPSHVRAMPLMELRQLFAARACQRRAKPHTSCATSWRICSADRFRIPATTTRSVRCSPPPRKTIDSGIPIRHENGRIHYAYPVSVLARRGPSPDIS